MNYSKHKTAVRFGTTAMLKSSIDPGVRYKYDRYALMTGLDNALAYGCSTTWPVYCKRSSYFHLLGARKHHLWRVGVIAKAVSSGGSAAMGPDPLSDAEISKAPALIAPSTTAQLATKELSGVSKTLTVDIEQVLASIPPNVLSTINSLAGAYNAPVTGTVSYVTTTAATVAATPGALQQALNVLQKPQVDQNLIEQVMPSDVPFAGSVDLAYDRQTAVDDAFLKVSTIKVGGATFTVADYVRNLMTLTFIDTQISSNVFNAGEIPMPKENILNSLADAGVVDILAEGDDVGKRLSQFLCCVLLGRYPAALPRIILTSFSGDSTTFLKEFLKWYPSFINGDTAPARYLRTLLTGIRITAQAADKYAFILDSSERRAMILLAGIRTAVETTVNAKIQDKRLVWSPDKLTAARKVGTSAIGALDDNFPLLRICCLTFNSIPLAAQTAILDQLGDVKSPVALARSKALAVRAWRTLEYVKYIQTRGVGTGFDPSSYVLIAEGNI